MPTFWCEVRMRYSVLVKQKSATEWVAQTKGEPDCMAEGSNKLEALNNIREEIRYRVEFCPCSWVEDDYVQLDVEELP